MPEPVDLARLDEFADGSADGVPRLVRLFLEDGAANMAQLAAACEAVDPAAVRMIAHRFGGSCAACGARALAAALFELERLDVSGGMSPAALFDRVATAYAEAIGFLSRYLEGHPEP